MLICECIGSCISNMKRVQDLWLLGMLFGDFD